VRFAVAVCVHNISTIDWTSDVSYDPLSVGGDRRRVYPIGRITVHSGYRVSSFSRGNDIAVLTTIDEMDFDSCVSPICLCDDRMTSSAKQCVTTGWGTIASGGKTDYVYF
jgi:Trypsin